MNERIDLIIFRTAERLFGIDGNEVERVINYSADIPVDFEKSENHIYADKFLNLENNSGYSATLLVLNKNNKKYLLTVPVLEDMITVPHTELIALPELIKYKQKPFIVWGFTESGGILITLITFDYYE